MGPRTAPNFCSQCGSSLSPDDAFCSQCGADVGKPTATEAATGPATGGATGPNAREAGRGAGTTGSHARRTGSAGGSTAGRSRSAFQRRIEDRAVDGWELERDYGDRVVMVDRGFGSVIVHAVLFPLTWGIGNAIYAWYSYAPGADRVELRDDGTVRDVSGSEGRFETNSGTSYGADGNHDAYYPEHGEADDESDDSLLGNPGSLVTSVVLALVGLGMLGDATGVKTVFIGLALLAGALLALPPVRRRLEEREEVTKFGRVRTTDEEVVDAPDVPCTACSRPVGTGVRRTFAEKLFVAGVPVAVDERGENCYCRSCAQGDPFTDDFAFEGARGEATTAEVEREL
ncbi:MULTISPECIES: zinc ribbon domain-containing protein [Halorussus]|uniref:zinc ribbon domain-containing protein n=1 Tax=Halorussus TaxID=1070314 RepID=UPI000E2196BD|nr:MULTISPECIES: zinc ribbon domain-containing protein [Halorussus]NHN58397.1 zinc ribbon domain-containing protein [Halorussus sp. JP-T4]